MKHGTRGTFLKPAPRSTVCTGRSTFMTLVWNRLRRWHASKTLFRTKSLVENDNKWGKPYMMNGSVTSDLPPLTTRFANAVGTFS